MRYILNPKADFDAKVGKKTCIINPTVPPAKHDTLLRFVFTTPEDRREMLRIAKEAIARKKANA